MAISSEDEGAVALTVVTGLSGSGISTALEALEDMGYFCIDNLPLPLVPKLLDLARSSPDGRTLAIGLDTRGLDDPARAVHALEALDCDVRILFLEAAYPALLRRYSESRRPHPLGITPLSDAIRAERLAMLPIREIATLLVDTTDLNVHECKRTVEALVAGRRARLALSVVSFGFRHGIPQEADIVWDVRFLPNPHFIPHLRPLTGRDAPVREYVLAQPATQAFLSHLLPLLDDTLPRYQREGKSYLTIALGCTGGHHRSVAIAERVCDHLRAAGHQPAMRHRDAGKG